jgi:hypothetical protein
MLEDRKRKMDMFVTELKRKHQKSIIKGDINESKSKTGTRSCIENEETGGDSVDSKSNTHILKHKPNPPSVKIKKSKDRELVERNIYLIRNGEARARPTGPQKTSD